MNPAGRVRCNRRGRASFAKTRTPPESESRRGSGNHYGGLDATGKAGIEATLNRCRALASKIGNELRNKRPEHFVDRWQTFTQRARRPRHRRAHATGRLHVRRAKDGSPSVHPMQGEEIRALRRLQREQEPSSHVFMTERDGPMTPKAFHALFGRIGARAKMPFPIHPHMLRHGCGYALANAGHDTRALPGLARAQEHPAHRALHRVVAASVQGLLALKLRETRNN
jgi:integrase